MNDTPIYVAPAYIDSLTQLSTFVRVDVMAHQLDPLPSVFVLAMNDKQWRDMMGGLRADVARVPISYIQGLTVVIPWDTSVTLETGLSWELACIRQGWLYEDPPDVFNISKIPIGPQYGRLPEQPNFIAADYLFASGEWAWLLWA